MGFLRAAVFAFGAAVVAGGGILPADKGSCASVTKRVDCGYESISEGLCTSRGCCFDKLTGACFYSTSGVPIKKVHVIMANHFDAGYTANTTSVINTYFQVYFPRAAAIGELLERNTTAGSPKMRWMTQSYLVSLYLDCPPSVGLLCPTDDEIKVFKNAVSKGWITYHAFPTNAELAAMHPEMIKSGFDLTHSIDDMLGVPNKTVLSQRDVPGLPRSSISLLSSRGVKAYSIGGNGRCNPPNVPQAFLWKDGSSTEKVIAPGSKVSSSTGDQLLTFWHAYGYGQLSSTGVWEPENGYDDNNSSPESPRLELPNFDEALIYAWKGDNQGPIGSKEEAESVWSFAKSHYPDAEIIASDLDAFSDAVLKAGSVVLDTLPVVTEDLSDTWIMGVQSDPWKEARARSFGRSLATCSADPTCPNDDRLKNAVRQSQKNGEHTWGLHIQELGKWYDSNWNNTVFHEGVQSNDPVLVKYAGTWVEQRDYGIRRPLQALGSHPVKQMMEKEFNRLLPQKPSTSELTPIQPGSVVDMEWIKFTINSDGSLSNIVVEGKSWPGTFGQVVYQTLNDDVYAAWRKNYLRAGTGGADEYGKPGVGPSISKNATYTPSGVRAFKNKTELVVELMFPTNLHVDYGLANSTFITYSFDKVNVVDASLQIFDKTATRLPEALYFKFTPTYNNKYQYFMDKLGFWTNPHDVLDGSGKGLHGITTGVAYSSDTDGLFFESLDATLLRWGHGLYPFASPMSGDVPLEEGFAFLLHDNSWNTNYPFWFPFTDASDPHNGDSKWDFALHF
eukprot:TRINITY_DN16358_c0_g1_i1.p1 TRINITY_DN16358_c0_g1~~TRINITY_DN16358_c0_g1_i1.p1  ORF type:complete len:787 (+),score=184.52 TRINITY_DN16358_c0_g1_i1:36-2396(+)